jgi:hypothetical protein
MPVLLIEHRFEVWRVALPAGVRHGVHWVKVW